jgi:hypothetical protein
MLWLVSLGIWYQFGPRFIIPKSMVKVWLPDENSPFIDYESGKAKKNGERKGTVS